MGLHAPVYLVYLPYGASCPCVLDSRDDARVFYSAPSNHIPDIDDFPSSHNFSVGIMIFFQNTIKN